MSELVNPETRWRDELDPVVIPQFEVERRLGATTEYLQLLSGGLANVSIRVGDERVLRIYRRDTLSLGKERRLLAEEWHAFRVPQVLGAGPDYLLLEYIAHDKLEVDDAAAIGRALAEIHQRRRFDSAGLLDRELAVQEPFADFVVALREHLLSLQQETEVSLWRTLLREVAAWLTPLEAPMRAHAGPAVLLHGDFKFSNLHRTTAADGSARPLVLDWEFAYAGPALMDVGELVRWGVPSGFVNDFLDAYRGAGGEISSEALLWAPIFDLANLGGLLARSAKGSVRGEDLEARIRSLIEAGAP